MSIRKPVNRVVQADDFHGGAYSFVVESVLSPDKNPGVVMLSASAGYLLVTSLTNQPKREQIIRYNRQNDDSWTATAVVTLIGTEESPVSGKVIIWDPSGETAVLTVDVVATSLRRVDNSSLLVNQPVVTFPGTSPGKPSFRVITIAQQGPGTPVTLTTDAPDYFQLASDSHPAFASSLTLTPSPVGTYVHVRYAADRYGSHTGYLTIQSDNQSETVTLKGRNVGPLTLPDSLNQAVVVRRGAVFLAMTLVMGLAWAGYSYRCQLFPALCQAVVSNHPTNNVPAHIPAAARDGEATRRQTTPTTTTEPVRSPGRQASAPTATGRSTKQPVDDVTDSQYNVSSSRSLIPDAGDRSKPAKQSTGDIVDKRLRRQNRVPTPVIEESELERELNRNLQN